MGYSVVLLISLNPIISEIQDSRLNKIFLIKLLYTTTKNICQISPHHFEESDSRNEEFDQCFVFTGFPRVADRGVPGSDNCQRVRNSSRQEGAANCVSTSKTDRTAWGGFFITWI